MRALTGLGLIGWFITATGAELWAAALLVEQRPGLAAVLALSAMSGVVLFGVRMIQEDA